MAVRAFGGRYRRSCMTRDIARRTSPARVAARISSGSESGPFQEAGPGSVTLLKATALGATIRSLLATVSPRFYSVSVANPAQRR